MYVTMLGTGNALVTRCYNTCFVLTDPEQPADDQHLLVDGGGGNGVLRQLELAHIDVAEIHEVFVTHKHLDHLLGILWVVRVVAQRMLAGTYDGNLTIYAHDEVVALLRSLAGELLSASQASLVDDRIRLVEVGDGEHLTLIGHDVAFFDIRSTKAKQFGFSLQLEGAGYQRPRQLVCCGDEPLSDHARPYAEHATLLMHEAFCLAADADRLHPHEKHHSTALEAGLEAEALDVGSLLLYHTEDGDLAHRRQRYSQEASQAFGGMVYVPDDLDTIEV